MVSKSTNNIELEDVGGLKTLNEEEPETPKKKKHPVLKYLLYFSIILLATGIALFLSLYQDFDGVMAALSKANFRYLLVILALVAVTYFLEGFIVFVFSRLYTRKYKYHQGLACSMVGAFYSAVTPGASGGQVMQTYTLKKQGVDTSNGASIMIMSFIVYQVALIVIGVIALFFSAGNLISTIGNFEISFNNTTIRIPAIPLTIAGFALNLLVIVGLFLLSYSRWFHNFIMHYGIDLLAKLKILKHPDKTRENLRIKVENFKIELRRLLSNIPVLLLVFVCFSMVLIIRFSIPFFAGLALDGYGYRMNIDGTLMTQNVLDAAGNVIGTTPIPTVGGPNIESFWQCVFLSAYHQMATGLIPLPGSAGVSEYFFNIMFQNFFTSQQITAAAQIIWRFSTFHIVLLVAGIVSATYKSSPKNEYNHVDRKTFVTMQYETYEGRKSTADTMYETASLSRKEMQMRLKNWGKKKKTRAGDDFPDETKANPKNEDKAVEKPSKSVKTKKKPKNLIEDEKWDSITTGGDD